MTQHTLPAPVKTTCDLFRLLAGHETVGLAPGEIAKALQVNPSWCSKTLPALAEIGFVERVGDTGRWRLGVAFVRISTTVAASLGNAQRQLDELKQRYATPH